MSEAGNLISCVGVCVLSSMELILPVRDFYMLLVKLLLRLGGYLYSLRFPCFWQ